MEKEKVKIIIDRLQNILNSLRNQNSGADSHTVGNIRNTASLMIQQLEVDPDCLEEALAEQILKNTEERLIKFYQTKYMFKSRHNSKPETPRES